MRDKTMEETVKFSIVLFFERGESIQKMWGNGCFVNLKRMLRIGTLVNNCRLQC